VRPKVSSIRINYATSPELLHGLKPELATRCDVYSFGIVAMEILLRNHSPAFFAQIDADHPLKLVEQILSKGAPQVPDVLPDGLARLMRRCVSWNPTERPLFSFIYRWLSAFLSRIEDLDALDNTAGLDGVAEPNRLSAILAPSAASVTKIADPISHSSGVIAVQSPPAVLDKRVSRMSVVMLESALDAASAALNGQDTVGAYAGQAAAGTGAQGGLSSSSNSSEMVKQVSTDSTPDGSPALQRAIPAKWQPKRYGLMLHGMGRSQLEEGSEPGSPQATPRASSIVSRPSMGHSVFALESLKDVYRVEEQPEASPVVPVHAAENGNPGDVPSLALSVKEANLSSSTSSTREGTVVDLPASVSNGDDVAVARRARILRTQTHLVTDDDSTVV
jgi:serine/threonine protein kinase